MNISTQSNIFELDTVAAFCKHAPVHIAAEQGSLSKLSYGLKDIYDIAGIPTGFGSPIWLKTHPIPEHTAAFILSLSNAGATLVGKTQTDELTYSILGINAHYGTPINSAAPLRVPGGSSSGSAAAVAAGLVDFAIGSDTGGSVRAPASFCGVYGIRTTHGLISLEHARPLAKSFDTLGWFTRTPQILLQVGEILLKQQVSNTFKKPQFYILKEAFELIPESVSRELKNTISRLFQDPPQVVSIAPEKLEDWAETFRIVQASEIWKQHGQWASEHLQEFGPGIKERFEIARDLNPLVIETATQNKRRIEHDLRKMISNLGDDTHEAILILPTTGCIAPPLDANTTELEQVRKHLFQLLCIAGLGGLPQVNLPLCQYQNAPLGLSLLGNINQDLMLLKITNEITQT